VPCASPYEIALGSVLDELAPSLNRYFSAVPAGHLGVATGVFTNVGTPRRWLWPALWLLQRAHILFPAWERDVPFEVTNRQPVRDLNGNVGIIATRLFRFGRGPWAMVDAITAEQGVLVDHLGSSRRIRAVLWPAVVNGSLHLNSTAISVRVGDRHVAVPRVLAPRVRLAESVDAATGMQRVSVTLDAPLIGRLYEYSGTFRYEIIPGERHTWTE
jgi:hypothetical protein